MVKIVCEAILDFIDDSECKNCCYKNGQITLDFAGGCPYRDDETTEEEIERIVNDEPLYIIPCGSKKIWSKEPNLGKVPANKVYIGAYTRNMIKYMEDMKADYIIFSGVYGLINPDMDYFCIGQNGIFLLFLDRKQWDQLANWLVQFLKKNHRWIHG